MGQLDTLGQLFHHMRAELRTHLDEIQAEQASQRALIERLIMSHSAPTPGAGSSTGPGTMAGEDAPTPGEDEEENAEMDTAM